MTFVHNVFKLMSFSSSAFRDGHGCNHRSVPVASGKTVWVQVVLDVFEVTVTDKSLQVASCFKRRRRRPPRHKALWRYIILFSESSSKEDRLVCYFEESEPRKQLSLVSVLVISGTLLVYYDSIHSHTSECAPLKILKFLFDFSFQEPSGEDAVIEVVCSVRRWREGMSNDNDHCYILFIRTPHPITL